MGNKAIMMEIQHIKVGIIYVAALVVQGVALGFYIGGVKNDIKALAVSITRVEDSIKDDKKERNDFEDATLTTVADLRTRVSILEARLQKK